MRFFHATALALLLVASASAAGDDPIRFPSAPVVPQPMPAPTPPSPDAAIRLVGEQLFVIDSKVECVIKAHPAGIVKVTKKKGPRDITAVFVDGTGFPEDREYQGPFIYVVQAVGNGRVELDAIPLGLKAESEIKSAVLDVGTLPLPPPKPPEPKPDPKPVDPPSPAPIPVAGLRVLIVYETADAPKMPPAQAAIIYGKTARDYLLANCAIGPDGKTREVRIWDKDISTAGESKLWQDAMARPRQSVPWIIVSNGKTGFEGPLPANVDEFLTLVKRYAN